MIDHPSLGWSSTVATKVVRWRLVLAIVGLVILGIAYPASRRLEFDRRIDAMFQPTDKTLLDYQELQRSFGGNSVVILVYQDQALTTAEGLVRNEAIATQVSEVEGVEGILSPALLNRAIEKLQPTSLLSSEPALFRQGDPVAEGFDELFSGYTHSRDHSRAAVVAMLNPNHPPQTLERIGQIAQRLPNEFGSSADSMPWVSGAVIVGEPVLIHDGFSLIERDGARLATLTVVLLSIVVVISLADLRFVLLTAAMISWSVIVTRGIMVWFGINLSLVSTILTAIVTVIAVTAVLHLGVRFRIARFRGHALLQATRATLTVLVLPILWTCATDAAGFAALYGSRILPIRQFGLMIAIAAVVVFVAALLLAPAVMMLPGLRIGTGLPALQLSLARRLRRRCLQVSHWSVCHQGWCLAIAVASAVIAVVGIGKARAETSFLNNFRPGSPVVRAYDDVETHFGGAGVWDVVLGAPMELTAEYLDQVRLLEDDLRKINIDGTRLTKVLSLADAEQIAGQAPLSMLVSPASRLSVMSLTMPVFFDALLTKPNSGRRKLRIMLRSREQLDSQRKTALIEEVQRRVADHVSSDRWREAAGEESLGTVTGYYVMMSRLVSQLIGDQWRCFFASGLLVWGLLVIATRSIRLATAALIPNLLPIFLVLALLGLFGGKINMGAAMIAAVSIGLSIDGSVHFLSGYQRYRDRGHDSSKSAAHAAGKIGVPVLLATIALIVGFTVLSTSDFIPTATFGMLVAAALALGTSVNLTLLPAIVSRIDR